MNGIHLSDEQIQDFLDGNRETAAVRHHLDDCTACRKILADYRLLYTELQKAPAWQPGRGFADAVIRRLPEGKRRKFPYAWAIAVGLSGFLAILAALIWGLELPFLKRLADQFVKPFSPIARYLGPVFGKVLDWLNGSVPLVVAAILAIVLVAVVDRFFGRRLLRASGARH